MERRNRNPHYWKVYHSSGISDPYRIIKLAHQIIESLGAPWHISRRGRPPEISPGLHAAICIFMLYINSTYRDMEGLCEPFFSRHVDHSTIGWAMQRIPPGFLTKALKLLYEKTDGLCGDGVFITDSTGMETDRYEDVNRVMKETRRRERRKLHVIVKLYPEEGIISIASAGESDGDRNDSPMFREIFDPDYCCDGFLFGDRGYDANANVKLCYDNGLVPVIKQRDYDTRPKGYRRKAFKDFDGELYRRYRGLVEGVFGGMETRYGNKTRCRLEHTRAVALAHNIRAYLRALAVAEVKAGDGIHKVSLFFLGIIRQPLNA
jgi:hypothetical protein